MLSPGEWRRIAIESMAVVLSILLAFAIDAYWDRYQDRLRERQLLGDLLTDFQESRPGLVARVELAQRMARNNRLFVDRISAHHGQHPLAIPDSLVLGALGGPTYEPNTNALDAAMNSGEIELISNKEIRAQLAHWSRLLLDTREDEIEVRRLTNEQLVPTLGKAVDLGPYYPELLTWSLGQPVTGLPGQVEFRPTPEISSLLSLRNFYMQFAADDLADLLEALDQMVAMLVQDAPHE